MIGRWLLTPMPATRLAALRILVGGYVVAFLVARAASFWQSAELPARQFEPVGPLVVLREPLPVGAAHTLFVVTILLGVAFVLGWRHWLIGPLFALAFLVVATYRLSFGHVIHTEHLPALHLLVLGVTPAADAWSLDARRRDRPPPVEPDERYGWPAQIMVLIVVVTYVLAGWAKVRHGGIDWLVGDVLRHQVAYDNLRKELLGSPHSPVGGWLVPHAWVFPPLALATVVIELAAPVVMLRGRYAGVVRAAWAASAWAFHVGILVLMAISFPYPLTFIAYAPLFAPERWLTWAAGRVRRRPALTT
jgi:hypothetical protein